MLRFEWRRAHAAGLALALGLALGSAAPAPARARGPATVTLTVALNRSIGYSGFFIAQSKGFFAQERLAIKEMREPAAPDALEPLLASRVDVAFTTLYSVALLAGHGDATAQIVYLLDTSSGSDAIVAAPAVASVADLRGRLVAVALGGVNELLLRKALESAKLGEGDVRIVGMNADDAGAALRAGRVDAAVTGEPWVSRARAAGSHVIYSSADTPNLILDAVVVTRRTLEARRAALLRFVRALDRGVVFLRDHPDEARTLVAGALETPAEDVDDMSAGDRIYAMDDNRILLAPDGAGGQALDAIARFLRSRKLGYARFEPRVVLSRQLLQ